MSDAPAALATPSAAALGEHLRRCAPRDGAPRVVAATGAFYAVAIAAVLVLPTWQWMLVWAGLMVWLVVRGGRAQAVAREMASVRDLMTSRHDGRALEGAWRLLPRLRGEPGAHVQAVAAMAACLARLGAHEASLVACDHVLRIVPGDSPPGAAIRLARLMALLRTDRLTDAAEELARLRTRKLTAIQRAAYTLSELYQQIKTNHHADAAIAFAHDEEAIQTLRPLAVDAGYGYALLAEACRAVDRPDDARRWWRRATMLVPPHAIAWALPETRSLLGQPAALCPAEPLEADAP